MVIETDVAIVASRFRVDAALLQAVVQAEGGGDAIIKAVQCSFPTVTTRLAALDILARSTVHAMSDFIKQGDRKAFVEFFGKRWAPPGVANDPHNLNLNWPVNVLALWQQASPTKNA